MESQCNCPSYTKMHVISHPAETGQANVDLHGPEMTQSSLGISYLND